MAISVPIVITLPAYNPEAAAENPHWGIIPNNAPQTGPLLLAAPILALPASPARCSRNSINKYVKNKKGNNLKLSSNVSNITSSNMFSPLKISIAALFCILYAFATRLHFHCIYYSHYGRFVKYRISVQTKKTVQPYAVPLPCSFHILFAGHLAFLGLNHLLYHIASN